MKERDEMNQLRGNFAQSECATPSVNERKTKEHKTTQQESLLIRGKLIGMGRLADCILSAERLKARGGELCEYRKITIEEAPHDLPDGRYELVFDEQVRMVQRLCGNWVNHFWNA